jgi:hypothetical protein
MERQNYRSAMKAALKNLYFPGDMRKPFGCTALYMVKVLVDG